MGQRLAGLRGVCADVCYMRVYCWHMANSQVPMPGPVPDGHWRRTRRGQQLRAGARHVSDGHWRKTRPGQQLCAGARHMTDGHWWRTGGGQADAGGGAHVRARRCQVSPLFLPDGPHSAMRLLVRAHVVDPLQLEA